MIANDHGRGWWAADVSGGRWGLTLVIWFSPLYWLTERTRWRDGWDFNWGPLSLEWRRWR
jgi:hypothetical protein